MGRCSYCGHNGHNSRTCPDRGVKLFGVRLTSNHGVPMNRSFSMGNISHFPISAPEQSESGGSGGYVSDIPTPSTRKCSERKKGVPWSEEEHRRFLVGLRTIGKGDWRGISKSFVITRTPSQVASHAQKYFLRQRSLNEGKRRSSLFDISADIERSTGPSLGRSHESTEQEEAVLRGSIGVARSGPFSVGIDGISVSPVPLWPDFGMKPPPNPAPSTTCNSFSRSQWKINNSVKPPAKISPFLAVIGDESMEHGTQLNLSIAPPSVDPPALSLGLNHQPPMHLTFHGSNNIDSNGSITGPISVI